MRRAAMQDEAPVPELHAEVAAGGRVVASGEVGGLTGRSLLMPAGRVSLGMTCQVTLHDGTGEGSTIQVDGRVARSADGQLEVELTGHSPAALAELLGRLTQRVRDPVETADDPPLKAVG